MEISFSSAFKRAFRKLVKGQRSLEEAFWTKTEIFTANPYDPRLRTHKLSGTLQEMWAFSVTYDIRVVFNMVEKDRAVFVDIGDHDAVY